MRSRFKIVSYSRALLFGAVIGAAFVPIHVKAQAYPERAVTVIVPSGAGTTSDVIARLVAARMAEILGKPFIVENIAGGASVPGTNRVAKAAPDGYTLGLLNSQAVAVNVSLQKGLPFNPVTDFQTIGRIMVASSLLGVSASLPFKNVQELIAYAKQNPKKLLYASQGNGSAAHLAGAYFAKEAGIELTHVPYNNVSQAFVDIAEGRVSMGFFQYNVFSPFLEKGTIRAIGTASAKRATHTPDVPTMIESGLPDWTYSSWVGLFAPAGMPQPIVKKLTDTLEEALKDPVLRDKINAGGTPVDFAPAAEFNDFVQREIRRYKSIIEDAGIEAQ